MGGCLVKSFLLCVCFLTGVKFFMNQRNYGDLFNIVSFLSPWPSLFGRAIVCLQNIKCKIQKKMFSHSLLDQANLCHNKNTKIKMFDPVSSISNSFSSECQIQNLKKYKMQKYKYTKCLELLSLIRQLFVVIIFLEGR